MLCQPLSLRAKGELLQVLRCAKGVIVPVIICPQELITRKRGTWKRKLMAVALANAPDGPLSQPIQSLLVPLATKGETLQGS
jgi:hypothetical protein